MTRIGRFRQAIEHDGFRLIPWDISRRSLNPFRELSALRQVLRVYKREQPDLTHHVALKPVIYGGFASRLTRTGASVNAITGLGHVFINSNLVIKSLRYLLCKALRFVLAQKNTITILQNDEDRELLIRRGVVSAERSSVIRGAGVDIELFSPSPEPTATAVVLLASRLLWDKGIQEFFEAAKKLREEGILARFVLVGEPDRQNPTAIPDTTLQAWEKSGLVEVWGRRDDMPAVLSQSNVVCLPSYLEGLPKVLVEAASCGRAIVAADVPGCRAVVRDTENGLLIPVRDSGALARALGTLVKNRELRARMGAKGREIAVREFSEEKIIGQTMTMYRQLLGYQFRADRVNLSDPNSGSGSFGCPPPELPPLEGLD